MAFQPVVDGVEVDVRGILDGQLVENTLYFKTGTGFGIDSLLSLAQVVDAWYKTNILSHLSDDMKLTEVYVTDLSTQTAPTAAYVEATPVAGGNSNEAMSNNVAPCISFRTSERGRSGRGRNYIPGISVDNVVRNTINATWAGYMVTGYEALPDAVADLDCTWCVLSRKHAGGFRPAGLLIPITSVKFSDFIVDSQRRRLPGRGA